MKQTEKESQRRKDYYQKNKKQVLECSERWFFKMRKKINQIKQERGNKCEMCGFNEEIRILQFHHLRDKKFEIGRGYKKTIEELREESKKCILLCPNCHFRLHLKNKKNV